SSFTERRRDQRKAPSLALRLRLSLRLRAKRSEENPHPKLNITRLREGGVQSAEVCVVSLTQTIELQSLQRRNVKAVCICGREAFGKLDVEEVQRQRATGQTTVGDQIVNLGQRRGTSRRKTVPSVDVCLRE